MFRYHRESCLHAGVRRYACLREAATAKAGHAGVTRDPWFVKFVRVKTKSPFFLRIGFDLNKLF